MNKKIDKATISCVAQEAKVSKTSISNFINGRYEYMSQQTREHIQEVIDKLGYRPNKLAKGLKSNKSNLIGALVADISNSNQFSPFSSLIIGGMGDVCEENGYNLIICNANNDTVKERKYILSLIDQKVEGLIIDTVGKNNEFLIEIKKSGIPIVLADRSIKEETFNMVCIDNYEIITNVVTHLISNGFKDVALLTQQTHNISTRLLREEAFKDTYSKNFHRDPESMIFYVDKSNLENSIISNVKHLVKKKHDRPIAILTISGVPLLSLMHCLKRMSLKIPGDFGVCGYDDWGWASLVEPGITAVSQPIYQMGVESAKLLLNIINHKENSDDKTIILPAKLTIRNSTILNQ